MLMLILSKPSMFKLTLSSKLAKIGARMMHFNGERFEPAGVGTRASSPEGLSTPCSTRPEMTTLIPLFYRFIEMGSRNGSLKRTFWNRTKLLEHIVQRLVVDDVVLELFQVDPYRSVCCPNFRRQ